MSLRTGGREAVEDTPVTGATNEQVQAAAFEFYQNPNVSAHDYAEYSEWATEEALRFAAALVKPGFVIVRAEDALTAEDRAAMKYLASFFDGYKAPEQVGCAAWEVKGTIERIAAGGQA